MESKAFKRTRLRLATQTTNGSFTSTINSSPLSFVSKSFNFGDTIEITEFYETNYEEQDDLMSELYFKVNDKVLFTNQNCVRVLNRLRAVQTLREKVDCRFSELNASQSDKAIKLLENQGNVNEMEKDLEKLSEHISFIEDELEKKYLEHQETLKKIGKNKKDLWDSQNIQQKMLSFEKQFSKLKILRGELKYQKSNLLDKYNTIHKKSSELSLLRLAIENFQIKLSEMTEKHHQKSREIRKTESANTKAKEELLEKEVENCEIIEELAKGNQDLEIKNYDIAMRKQWIKKCTNATNSKKTLNKIMISQIDEKLKAIAKKKADLNEISLDLDHKETLQEIHEFELKAREKSFSLLLSSILKKKQIYA